MTIEEQHIRLHNNKYAKALAETMHKEVYPTLFELLRMANEDSIIFKFEKDKIGLKININNTIDYMHEERIIRTYPMREIGEIVFNMTFRICPPSYDNLNVFYFKYCEFVLTKVAELREQEFGFDRLNKLALSLIMPLERKVIVEKYILQSNEI